MSLAPLALVLILLSGEPADPMPPPGEVARGIVDEVELNDWAWIDGVTWWIGSDALVRHERDGPDSPPLALAHCLGRRVSMTRDGRTTVTILGGEPPIDFAMALSVSRWVADVGPIRSPATPLEACAVIGLGVESYATRNAAQRILVARGMESVPALALAQRSRSIEVRERASHALRLIRDGE